MQFLNNNNPQELRSRHFSSESGSFQIGIQLVNVTGWLILLLSENVLAASKAPPNSGSPGSSTSVGVLTTPVPARSVVVTQIGTKAFELPNGVNMDLTADLQSMWNTVVTNSSVFVPTQLSVEGGGTSSVTSPSSPCNSHLEIRSALTTFQLNVAQLGITFGFTPGGALGPVSSIQGQANLQIGEISMDFSVWSCVSDGLDSMNDTCVSVLASHADQSTAGISSNVTVDFSIATTAANFLYNTPIGNAMKAIMASGMSQLVNSPRLNLLPWQAQVKELLPSSSAVSPAIVFDAGVQEGIMTHQAFEVYAPTDSSPTGVCNVYQVVADVHTSAVDSVSSTAVVDQWSDASRGILVGDVVMVRVVGAQ